MRKCLKRSVVLLLLLTLCLTAISAINTTPANAAANEIMVFPYPRPADNNKNNWGKEAMSFMGGWSQRAADNFSVYSNDYSGKIYYCIEPGQYIKTGDSYVEKDEAYWDNFPRNSTIDRDEIKEHIGRIFQYGYIGTINLDWTSQNDADTLGNVIATQILIWEVVVGERDSEFNHVAPGTSYDAVLDIVSPNHPVYSQIMKQYNRIVNAMQAHLDSPSFMAEEKDKAETVELRWNGTEYSASLTDTNNVLSNYEIKPSDTNVQVTVSGNKLILTSKVAVNNVTLTAIRTLKRSGLITWASSTRQDLTKPYSAEVSDPLQAFIKLKTQQTGSIKGIKVDTNGNPLAGAEIGLFYGSETNLIAKEAIKVLTTGADGVFEFDNIAYGKYIVKELTAPNNYKLDDTAYKVEISENQKLVELEIVNTFNPGAILIQKSSDDNAVAGIEFTVTGGDLTEPLKGVTDEKGNITFPNLTPGEYAVAEAVPDKYKPQDVRYISVAAGQTSTVYFSNTVKKGSITGIKVDDKKQPLAEAVIGLFKADVTSFTTDTAIKTVTTASDGAFEFKDIPYGKYLVKEIEAPKGYIINDTVFDADINADGIVIELEIENPPLPKNIEITKTDVYGNLIAGAEFTLETSSDGGKTWEKVSIAVSDDKGLAVFKDLQPNVLYRITETKAPDGFQILSAPVFQGELEISEETLIKYTVVNAAIYELPKTGGNSFILVTVCITLALLLCTFLFLKKSKVSEYKNI